MGVMKKALQDKLEGRDSVQERFFPKKDAKVIAPPPSIFNQSPEQIRNDELRKQWEKEYATWNRGFF
jgi:hypothetical protein